jgi:hypothetical protein
MRLKKDMRIRYISPLSTDDDEYGIIMGVYEYEYEVAWYEDGKLDCVAKHQLKSIEEYYQLDKAYYRNKKLTEILGS